jgi:RHS repeat-associated protein
MGNPTTYRGYTMTWRGKQLAGFTGGTKTVSFEYNEDGLRQQKTYNGVVTNYYYNGSVLIGMQRGTAKERFSYDASGNVVSVIHNGTEYYYLRNAQGDIVKLIDASGATVVEYTYDTWGKKVSTTGSLAGSLGLVQPFRYRGYVYDWETGLYYLQSRYYDPEVGRFISADVLLSTGQGVLGHNCYAYCLGNPVGMSDQSGSCPFFIPGCPGCMIKGLLLIAGSAYLINLKREQNAYNNVVINDNDSAIQKWKGKLEGFSCIVKDVDYLQINISGREEDLDLAIQEIGIVNVCYIMACAATSQYKSEKGSDFALLEKTVAFEIQYHVEGYLFAKGKKEYGLTRDLTTC